MNELSTEWSEAQRLWICAALAEKIRDEMNKRRFDRGAVWDWADIIVMVSEMNASMLEANRDKIAKAVTP